MTLGSLNELLNFTECWRQWVCQFNLLDRK